MPTFRLTGLLALLLVFAVPASAQAAAPKDGMGCPQGFVAFDAQKGGGGPPSYLPGSEAVASGYLTDATTKAAPSVALRWGAPDGPVVGEAALDAQGNFQGLRFTIPAETPHAIYALYLEAYGADGQMLPGLPIPTRLRVGPPPAATVAPARIDADRGADAARRKAPRATRPRQNAAGEPPAAAKVIAPAPRAREVAEAVTPAPRVHEAAARSVRPRPAAEARRSGGAAVRPLRTGGPRPRAVAPAPEPTATPSPAAGTRDDGVAEPVGPLALAMLLGLLGLAGALSRRRHGPVPPSEPVGVPEDDPVEAALQQLLAREATRPGAPGQVTSEPEPEPALH